MAGPRDASLATSYDLLMFDLDGVVYVDGHAVEHAAESIAARATRAPTSRSSPTTRPVPPRRWRPTSGSSASTADLGDVVTSSQAAARLLLDAHGPGAPIAVLGARGLVEALAEAGLEPVEVGDPGAVAVVSGYAPDVRVAGDHAGGDPDPERAALGRHEHRSDAAHRQRLGARPRVARSSDQRLRGGHTRSGGQASAAAAGRDPSARARRAAADGGRPVGHRHRRCNRGGNRLLAGDDRGQLVGRSRVRRARTSARPGSGTTSPRFDVRAGGDEQTAMAGQPGLGAPASRGAAGRRRCRGAARAARRLVDRRRRGRLGAPRPRRHGGRHGPG